MVNPKCFIIIGSSGSERFWLMVAVQRKKLVKYVSSILISILLATHAEYKI